ncbi:MAG: TetR/AcrR family transcriptional regulator, partial [Bacteroidota bacterium]
MEKLIEPWLKAGYDIFSQEGPGGLKVERLARIVGKSKSSFYHHFADLEIYTSFLLEYH